MNHPPYFINPALDELATASGERRTELTRRIAACIGDEATLRSLIGIDPAEFAGFYPDMNPAALTTEATISSFISRFSSEKAAETPEIEEIVAAPAVDYAYMLEQEDSAAESDRQPPRDDATSDAISAFLQSVPPKTPARRRQPESSEPVISEALFRLMVKNKNYSKALEIITELSLNNPKKSIYFAYQTRFLKKLIKNSENRPS